MATVFENVRVSVLSENDEFQPKYDNNIKIEIKNESNKIYLALSNGRLIYISH